MEELKYEVEGYTCITPCSYGQKKSYRVTWL